MIGVPLTTMIVEVRLLLDVDRAVVLVPQEDVTAVIGNVVPHGVVMIRLLATMIIEEEVVRGVRAQGPAVEVVVNVILPVTAIVAVLMIPMIETVGTVRKKYNLLSYARRSVVQYFNTSI